MRGIPTYFVALPMPLKVYDHLAPPQYEFVPLGKRHLTLVYLGPLAASSEKYVLKVVAEVARLHEPFPVRFIGLAAFPSLSRPKHLAALAEPEAKLLGLREDLRRRLSALEKDRYAEYRPHVTVASTRAKPDLSLILKVERTVKASRRIRALAAARSIALYRAVSGHIEAVKTFELG